ncbi:MAG: PCRF domain-containing protein, partial [Syntrophomonadaceae bacterium]|nr:PCRF domain-containing protein [Syntrophomonadaceae bacterium]
MEEEILLLEKQTLSPNFWDDNRRAQEVLRRISELKDTLTTHSKLLHDAVDLRIFLALASEEEDEALFSEAVLELERLNQEFEVLELSILFTGDHDRNNAIVSLHAGAGGTDAQDWAEMLMRIYSRSAEDNMDGQELWDLVPGDEAGIKSATILLKGRHAYGKMKTEHGVHRLVRVSP